MIEVDLTGVFFYMKCEIDAMLKTGGGAIVNTASVLGVVAMPITGDYTAAKHGVIGVTKSGSGRLRQEEHPCQHRIALADHDAHRRSRDA